MKQIHIPAYWLIVGIAVMLISPLLSIVASVQIAERNVHEMARIQQERRCEFYGRTLAVYDREPPGTETGKALREAYLLEYRERGCPPERTS